MEDRQTGLGGFQRIVGALEEFRTALVADAFGFGRHENLVVDGIAAAAVEAGGQTLKQDFIFDLEVNGIIDLFAEFSQHRVQTVSLGNGTGEAVEDEAVFAIGFSETVFDHGADQFIHDHTANLMRALSMHSDTEVVFFLGDGLCDLMDINSNNSKVFRLCVRGNCDPQYLFEQVPKMDTINLMGYKIVLTHGDLYGVKWSDEGLVRLCEEESADIVLFGHTHMPRESYIELPSGRNAYFFNPGSIGSADSPTYGVINLTERGVLFSHGRL